MLMSSPRRVLVGGTAVVAASTAALPQITGYGTILYQNVVLGAWGIVAAVTSGKYADQHHGPVWSMAVILNVGTFLLPALVIFYGGRRR